MQNCGTFQYNQRFYYDEKWKEGRLLVKSNFSHNDSLSNELSIEAASPSLLPISFTILTKQNSGNFTFYLKVTKLKSNYEMKLSEGHSELSQ